ncbi:XdhC family protein [Oerskovia flava]|uniref:XdhC family protein n=1 Tax=Oerskovia flava TaxID=2986422 RepID=UPI00223F761F|nr:XdhC/CoxI family protein [Oerskovia sp. JB1-3-2]
MDEITGWFEPGRPAFAVATIVGASGSVPRPVGTAMAVRVDGRVVGSLSGGCVEAAVHAACLRAISVGRACREAFGYSDADAFAVGLTCGGTLDVHVQPLDPTHPTPLVTDLARHARDGAGDAPTALVRRIDTTGTTGVLLRGAAIGSAEIAAALGGLVEPSALESVARQVDAALRTGGTAVVRAASRDARDGSEQDAPVTLLVETRRPAPRLVVAGANDFAGALVRAASLLGYRITLVDAREVFADAGRYREAEVVVEWPDAYLAREHAAGRVDERTAVVVLTHDPKFDVPLLRLALGLPLAYVGAMGSRRAHAQRVEALRAEGVADADLARLRSPVGLDLGAVGPEEVAVSICAELVAARHGRATVAPLSAGDGPLHDDQLHGHPQDDPTPAERRP